MAGPSQNVFPGSNTFPGGFPPVAHGATSVFATNNTSSVLLVTFGEEEKKPMKVFEIKRGDSWRPLEAVLLGPDGPIDLTGADRIRLRLRSSAVTVLTGDIDIVDAAAGKVSYQWQRPEGDPEAGGQHGDLDFDGSYRAEFEIEWNTGDLQTVPNNDYFSVVVYPDLDPGHPA